MLRRIASVFGAVVLAACLSGVSFADHFFVIDATRLNGGPPIPADSFSADSGMDTVRVSEGEVYQAHDPGRLDWQPPTLANRFALRLPDGVEPGSVQLFVRAGQESEWTGQPIPQGALSSPADAEKQFWNARAWAYAALVARQLPGGALFRAYRDEAFKHLTKNEKQSILFGVGRWTEWTARRTSIDDDTLGLLSGGRALRENLQLDLVLATSDADVATTVPLESLQAVTIKPIDWAPYLKDQPAPELDSLAAYLPADNISVLMPSFDSLVAVVDESERVGNPIADAATQRATNARTRQRLEAQLLLSLDGFARQFGKTLVGEVAVSADDLYVLDGTGIAVVMRAKQSQALLAVLGTAQEAAIAKDSAVQRVSGTFGDASYIGVVNPSRSVSSHVMVTGDVVVVANSLPLLERIAHAKSGAEPALASLDEYRFFRTRYRRDANEDGFCLLTDAAIRKMTGPRWRIGQSRRVRAGAALADMAVKHRDEILTGEKKPQKYTTAWVFTGPTEVILEPEGPRHVEYGSFDFLTPVAELKFDKVTSEEAANYARFRDAYQNRWTRFFDPIAVQVRARGGFEVDVTVMPLIAGTDYNDMIQFTGTETLAPGAGDPHDESIAHFIMHLDTESRELRQVESMLSPNIRGTEAPLRWMSGALELYADADPFWTELKAQDPAKRENWLEKNWRTLPVAVRVGSRNGLGLAAFLTGARGMIESSAPNMTTWTTKQHAEMTYVQVDVDGGGDDERATVFYVTEPGALTLSLREEVVTRAIDRSAARKAAKANGAAAPESEWLGGSVAAHAEADALAILAGLLDDESNRRTREESYANIPILNEWKRLYPDRDPVDVHRRILGTTLECPNGQGYQWNEKLHTMESVALGSPRDRRGEPRSILPMAESIDTGLTFETDGLRARVRLAKP